MAAKRISLLASAIGIGAGFVWSFGAITARKAADMDAFQYLIWRSIGVVAVMELSARVRGARPLMPKAYRSGRTMHIGVVMLLVASLAWVYSLKATSAANAAFLASTTPLIALVLARIVLGERLTRITVGAVAVAFAGLIVMVWGNLGGGHAVGNLAAFASSVGFAGYAVAVRSDQQRDWSPILPGYAALMIALCSAITLAQGKTLIPPLRDIALAVLHGGLFIVIGTLMYNYASKHVAAVPMTIFAQAEMVGVPVWAFLFLHERPHAQIVLGGLIVLVAIVGNAVLSQRAAVPVVASRPVGASASTS